MNHHFKLDRREVRLTLKYKLYRTAITPAQLSLNIYESSSQGMQNHYLYIVR